MKMKHIIPMMLFASAPMASGAQTELKSGINLENLDNSVRPQDDFYQYACGGWMKLNPLPASYSRYGSFDKLQENNQERINKILNELLENTYPEGSVERKLSDFYKLAMDSVRRNEEGVSPVMPLLKEMDSAPTKEALILLQRKYAAFGYGVPFSESFDADEKNAKMNILQIYQGGLSLGQKEYYLDTDSATTAIREAYKKHIERMFQIFGYSDAESTQKMQGILRIETALAEVSKTRAELRDVEANYNKITIQEFETSYPYLGLTSLLEAEGIKKDYFEELVIGQPVFLKGANDVVESMTEDEMRAYMQWDAILHAANYLSDDVVQANFDFFGKTMSGRKENYPLWKRSTSQVESKMGEILGKMYVERYFPSSSKQRMQKLVENLQASLEERIMAQDWMSDTTKTLAMEKLSTFYVKIGYPDKWKDISAMVINPSLSYYENMLSAQLFWNNWVIENRAGKPVDRDEWHMTPQTVNAYYNPTTNEICFPAGILQVPFFDPEADDAFNYGAIGVVIGHEMTHGFDDQGRHYDKDGNMTDWWTKQDAENFTKRADAYADFFSSIKVLPDLNANGRLTLGENLADHGGLQVAYNAYKNATMNSPLNDIDGFSADERFFLAYAGLWATNITEEEIRNRTKSDPHSLGRWRVNGALPHVDVWYNAFNVEPNDKMYLPEEERLKLW